MNDCICVFNSIILIILSITVILMEKGVRRMNNMECGKCGYFDGMSCQKTGEDRDIDEIVEDCIDFDLSIYY